MSRDDAPDDLLINVADSLLDVDLGPLPVGPTGDFVPAAASLDTDPIPEASEDTFICLRDCRYYMEQKPYFAAGNTRGTLDHIPILTRRTCMRISGYEIDLTDEVMHDCSAWDPWMPDEKDALAKRRELYYQIRKSKE